MNAKELRDVLMSFEQAEKDYLWSCDQVDLYDKETQDILHSLELDPRAKTERNRLATRLQRIRRQRREHKNIFEVNDRLLNYCKANKALYVQSFKRSLG
jgi:hypothetical protein